MSADIAEIPNGAAAAAAELTKALKAVSQDAMCRDVYVGVARSLGLVEEHEVKKPCRSCGHPQHDYSYSKLTLAGQAYLALALLHEEASKARSS